MLMFAVILLCCMICICVYIFVATRVASALNDVSQRRALIKQADTKVVQACRQLQSRMNGYQLQRCLQEIRHTRPEFSTMSVDEIGQKCQTLIKELADELTKAKLTANVPASIECKNDADIQHDPNYVGVLGKLASPLPSLQLCHLFSHFFRRLHRTHLLLSCDEKSPAQRRLRGTPHNIAQPIVLLYIASANFVFYVVLCIQRKVSVSCMVI